MIGQLGWKKQKIDRRDWKFSVAVPKVLPVRSSLLKFACPVKDQGTLGSCTAFAYCGVIETITQHHKLSVDPYSELFHYQITLDYEGSFGQDTGCELRDTVKCGAKQGTCLNSLWPYKISKFTTKPPNKAYAQALEHQILTYEALTTLQEMKTCIASLRHPFLFGFYVYESFEAIGPDGKMPTPNTKREDLLGGHAVFAVGYNDKFKNLDGTLGAFLIQNSWGPEFGLEGRFWMPYSVITNKNLAMDFWRVMRGELM